MDGSEGSAKKGQFVRIELPGKDRILHLAEVQAFAEQENVALKPYIFVAGHRPLQPWH